MAIKLKAFVFLAFAVVVGFTLYFIAHAAPQTQTIPLQPLKILLAKSSEQLQSPKVPFKIPEIKPVLVSLPSTISPSPGVSPLTEISKKSVLKLLSLNKLAHASVHGNLGGPSVITNEKVEDWLADRWQAAKNMNGEPIPGEHWVEVDLGSLYRIRKFLIDWEAAYSVSWSILGKTTVDSEWKELCLGKDAFVTSTNKKHVIHEIIFQSDEVIDDNFELTPHDKQIVLKAIDLPFRFVRLHIFRPSTQWGSSIWRFQIWGYE